jgi:hypothetical protein
MILCVPALKAAAMRGKAWWAKRSRVWSSTDTGLLAGRDAKRRLPAFSFEERGEPTRRDARQRL